MLALLLPLSTTAALASPVDLELVSKGQQGQAPPALVLVVNQDATSLDVRFTCGGESASRSGAATAGERLRLEVSPPLGQHQCTGTLTGAFADGSEGEMPLNFGVQVLPALKVEVPREHLDLEQRRMVVRMDRPPGRVEVVAYGLEGAGAGEGTAVAGGLAAGDDVEVQWTGQGEVIRLQVKGYDADGFWSAVDLFPWSYAIPHVDVEFESGKADIREGEEQKLRDARGEVDKVLKRYGEVAEVKLYVAGYTDTVGAAGGNVDLSWGRARSIAAWFKANGFPGDIYYQGFGEGVLAVATPDETDEPANRRALYLVAAETPPTSTDLPRSDWRRLK